MICLSSRALSPPGDRRRQGDLFLAGKVRKDFARQAKVSLAALRRKAAAADVAEDA
jgi:hypothetical protein